MLQNVFDAFFRFVYFKPHLYYFSDCVAVALFFSLKVYKKSLVVNRVGNECELNKHYNQTNSLSWAQSYSKTFLLQSVYLFKCFAAKTFLLQNCILIIVLKNHEIILEKKLLFWWNRTQERL